MLVSPVSREALSGCGTIGSGDTRFLRGVLISSAVFVRISGDTVRRRCPDLFGLLKEHISFLLYGRLMEEGIPA